MLQSTYTFTRVTVDKHGRIHSDDAIDVFPFGLAVATSVHEARQQLFDRVDRGEFPSLKLFQEDKHGFSSNAIVRRVR